MEALTGYKSNLHINIDVASNDLLMYQMSSCVRGQLGRLRSLARPKRPTLSAIADKTQTRLMQRTGDQLFPYNHSYDTRHQQPYAHEQDDGQEFNIPYQQNPPTFMPPDYDRYDRCCLQAQDIALFDPAEMDIKFFICHVCIVAQAEGQDAVL